MAIDGELAEATDQRHRQLLVKAAYALRELEESYCRISKPKERRLK